MGYTGRSVCRKDNSLGYLVAMRKQIMNCVRKNEVYFIDGNALNHQKNNLVELTKSELYRTLPPKNGLKYRGVIFNSLRKKYNISISLNSKRIHLGYSSSLEEALAIYDAAVRVIGPKYAFLNNPEIKINLPVHFVEKIKQAL